MSEGIPGFEIVHVATYRLRPSGAARLSLDDPSEARPEAAPELTEILGKLTMFEPVLLDDVDDGLVLVRWHYSSPRERASDAHAPAEEATQVANAIGYQQLADPRLDNLRETHQLKGQTTFALTAPCKEVHQQFASTFFDRQAHLLCRALQVCEDDIPDGISIWKNRLATYWLILADPESAALGDAFLAAVVTGGLDHVEAWWHNIARREEDYMAIRGETSEQPQKRTGLLGRRDDLRDHTYTLLDNQTGSPDQGILTVILHELRRIWNQAGKGPSKQEILVAHHHAINRAITEAATVRADLERCRINMKEEARQLRGLAKAVGDCRGREAKFPIERIRLDLDTVQPQLDTAQAFLQKDTDERVGVLTLWVVPLTMMQVALGVLQIGWLSAETLWLRVAGIVLSVLVLVAFLPGIRYSLSYAGDNRGIRSLTSLVVIVAIVCYLAIPLLLFAFFR